MYSRDGACEVFGHHNQRPAVSSFVALVAELVMSLTEPVKDGLNLIFGCPGLGDADYAGSQVVGELGEQLCLALLVQRSGVGCHDDWEVLCDGDGIVR